MNRVVDSLLLLCIIAAGAVWAQAQPSPPKREFRGVWIATVRHLDYPSRPTTDPEVLKREYRELIRRHRETGLNAVVFQVRPAADAFYPSELAPWSADLTGQQGVAPLGGFDPLTFYIEEAHRQGMEFHAWLNPYRATLDLDTLRLSPGHLFYQHRNWLVRYGDRFYLNPSLPEVRDHLAAVVAELVARYDLDAIHFDDYFYPYPIPGSVFPDSLDFAQRGAGFGAIEDWRRSNTDALVSAVSQRIKVTRQHVRFGISPFGVWRNDWRDPAGSPTRAGASSYDDLYADLLKWMRFGWIDYVAPQLYWSAGFPPADHRLLLDWWNKNRNGRHLYIGYAAYKVGNNIDSAWFSPRELPGQVDLARSKQAAQGGIYFRSGSLLANPLGVRDSLANRYRYPALIPEFSAPALSRLHAPERLKVRSRRQEVQLSWQPNREDLEVPPAYYVVYRFPRGKEGQTGDPANILATTPIGARAERFEFTDRSVRRGARYIYTVSAVNRYHVEGPVAEGKKVKGR